MIIQYPDLKNKIVLITGATRGIGKTIAEALAIQGAHVVFNYRQGKEEIAENFKKSQAYSKRGSKWIFVFIWI